MPAISVIIVTHDSAGVLPHCLAALAEQSVQPEQVWVVDSGSKEPSYLYKVLPQDRVIRLAENVGYSRANNAGYQRCDRTVDYLLFMNPDTMLLPDAVERAVRNLEADKRIGILTGRLLGYDFERQQPTGLLDSTGIFRKWYGRWVDRGQGEVDQGQFDRREDVPAACGAMLFCRRSVLEKVILPGGDIFDPDFFLYKEDIELSLRIRRKGWRVCYAPEVVAWHGRGWRQRRKMSLDLRRIAASSELTLYRKHPSPYLLWALLKYLSVRLLKM